MIIPVILLSDLEVTVRLNLVLITSYCSAMAGNAQLGDLKTIVEEDCEKLDKDNERLKSTPYRLRNHSYQQANASMVQSISNETSTILEEAEKERGPSDSDNDSVMGSMEDITSSKFLLRREDWQKKNTAFKLESVFDAVNKMYSMHAQCLERIKPLEYAVFDPEGGILPQLTSITTHAEESQCKQSTLEGENAVT